MARNGSGTYSLPSGNPVTTGTYITSTWANNTLSDIATALTGSLAADGQTTATGNLKMGTNKVTGMGNGTAATDAVAVGQVPALMYTAGNAMAGSNILAAARNLVVAYATVATVTATADLVVVETSAGATLALPSFNKTANITVSGLGGLLTGAEASSTWYHIWALAKSDGTQNIGLAPSATLATVLAYAAVSGNGYTYAGYLGAIYNTSGSDFNPIKQFGAVVSSYNASNALTNGTATSFTAISNFDLQVPSTAKTVQVQMTVGPSAGTAATSMVVASEGATTTPVYGQAVVSNVAGGTSNAINVPASVVLTTAQQLKYYVAGANAQGSVGVQGWTY